MAFNNHISLLQQVDLTEDTNITKDLDAAKDQESEKYLDESQYLPLDQDHSLVHSILEKLLALIIMNLSSNKSYK